MDAGSGSRWPGGRDHGVPDRANHGTGERWRPLDNEILQRARRSGAAKPLSQPFGPSASDTPALTDGLTRDVRRPGHRPALATLFNASVARMNHRPGADFPLHHQLELLERESAIPSFG